MVGHSDTNWMQALVIHILATQTAVYASLFMYNNCIHVTMVHEPKEIEWSIGVRKSEMVAGQ